MPHSAHLSPMERPPPKECWPCRNRHVRCDQSQRPCAKCLRSGLECSQERPIRWVKGVAIRGKMQGHVYRGPAEKSSVSMSGKKKRIVFKAPTIGPTPRSVTAVPKTSRVVSGLSAAETGVDDAGRWAMSPSAALQTHAFVGLDRVSGFYLDYYEHICDDFVVTQMDKSLLRNLLPLALNDLVLQKVLIALSARHLANRRQSFHQPGALVSSENTKANRDALAFKHHAISALSRALRNSDEVQKDTTTASVFLLILLDLLESGGSGWQYHLEAAKGLLDLNQLQTGTAPIVDPQPPRFEQDLRGFLTKQMYSIETLGSLFIRPADATSLSPRITFDEQELAQESIEDSFLGCPAFLMRAIRFISAERDIIAAQSQHMHPEAQHAHEAGITAMLNLIEDFDCYKSPFEARQKESSLWRDQQREAGRRCVLAEVYKIAALIYGRRVLAVLTRAEASVDELVSELLGLLDALRGDQDSLKCVLWPLFVAGLECRSPAQRQYFILHLEQFWMATKCLNVVNATKILQEYWVEDNAGLLSWPFNHGLFGRVWLLI